MAGNPPARPGFVRVVRILQHVTEMYLDTTVYPTPALQTAAAKAAKPNDWTQRPVLPDGGADAFEMVVVGNDGV